jgi:riboflavin synthase
MFTGLIEQVGRLERIERRGASGSLVVAASFPSDEVRLGDSIAVNGVCLTVTQMRGGSLTFDVSPETLERTSFKDAAVGAPVNLERALRLSDRLGGHLVTGHVDCLARLAGRREVEGNIVMSFTLPAEHARFIVAKGSVAIDGISLTVNAVSDDGFSVNIIPHTAALTTLSVRRAGDLVNIETDILGKYLDRLLSTRHEPAGGGGLSLELLAKSGFL